MIVSAWSRLDIRHSGMDVDILQVHMYYLSTEVKVDLELESGCCFNSISTDPQVDNLSPHLWWCVCMHALHLCVHYRCMCVSWCVSLCVHVWMCMYVYSCGRACVCVRAHARVCVYACVWSSVVNNIVTKLILNREYTRITVCICDTLIYRIHVQCICVAICRRYK
jgi:hypothetical protein